MGDLIGRNKAWTLTLGLAAVSAVLSAILPMGNAETVYIIIIICRFAMGIGLGGVYPLSATKAAEDAAANNQGSGHGNSVDSTSAAKAFFWQGPGAMGPWVLALMMTYNQNLSTNSRWRLILGLGGIPAAMVVFGSLLRMPSPQRNWRPV